MVDTMTMSEEMQYVQLVKRIISDGSKNNDRTGIGTRSLFGMQMRFSLRQSVIPLLTTKRVNFRAILEELLWFISGSTNAADLSARGVRIWDANASRETLNKLGFSERRVGDLGPIYGFQWRHFGAEYNTAQDDYTGMGMCLLCQAECKLRLISI